LAAQIDHARMRFLADALQEATAFYWQRRAETFEWAMPRPGDFTGRATPADLEARRQRLAAVAQACRERAQVSTLRSAA
jgi:hypothetical protein